MNNKGQTLIIFVILVPILITLIAIVVDVGLMHHEQIKIKGLIDDGIREYYQTKNLKEIKEILTLNDISTENLTIKTSNQEIEVTIEYTIEAIFGKMIQMNEYDIKITRHGKLSKDNVIIE